MKTFYVRSLHWLAMLGFLLLGAAVSASVGALLG